MNYVTIGIGIIIGIIILVSIKIVRQYERGVKFTLGKYTGIMQPGINIVLPAIQDYELVDIRQTTLDLKPQEVITKDKVNLKIDGIVFYTIEEPEKVILNVEDLERQLSGKATSELKEIIGDLTMSESLSQREKIANELQTKLNEAITDKTKGKGWGIHVRAIQINNIELPESLIRAMAKQAEAEREKEARITKAEGELIASKKFEEASRNYIKNPAALRLRELQTYQEIGTEHNTLMLVIPETMVSQQGTWTIPLALTQLEREKEKKKEVG